MLGGGKGRVVAEEESRPEDNGLGRTGDEEGTRFLVIIEWIYKLIMVCINIFFISTTTTRGEEGEAWEG
jgi:hypothetical protein